MLVLTMTHDEIIKCTVYSIISHQIQHQNIMLNQNKKRRLAKLKNNLSASADLPPVESRVKTFFFT